MRSPEYKKKISESNRKRRLEYKAEVFAAYGNKCSCCSEDTPLFLTIDHVNDDGNVETRNKEHFYRKIIKLGFPVDYRILCWNCNCARAINGGVCPHVQQEL